MFHLVEPELGRVSGGLRYNHAMADAAQGQILRHQLPGAWPRPAQSDIAALQRLVDDFDRPVLLDGLIGCSLPQPLETNTPVVQLVHALATTPEEQQREQDCLQAADEVITISHFAAAELQHRYNITAAVASPGVETRPLAAGSTGSHFISVGAVEPNKNQLFLLEVLQHLHQWGLRNWHYTVAGPLTDRSYARLVQTRAARFPEGSITIAGELDAKGMAELYDSADLLLLPSRSETFGLVVHEATAAGIPAIVTAGTGAEEALGGGLALQLDPTVWATELRRWLTSTTYRQQLRARARAARQALPYGWEHTAKTVLQTLHAVSLR